MSLPRCLSHGHIITNISPSCRHHPCIASHRIQYGCIGSSASLLKISRQLMNEEVVNWPLGHLPDGKFFVHFFPVFLHLRLNHVHHLKAHLARVFALGLHLDELANRADREPGVPAVVLRAALDPRVEHRAIAKPVHPHRTHVAQKHGAPGANLDAGVVFGVEVDAVRPPVQMQPLVVLQILSEAHARLGGVHGVIEEHAFVQADVAHAGLQRVRDGHVRLERRGVLEVGGARVLDLQHDVNGGVFQRDLHREVEVMVPHRAGRLRVFELDDDVGELAAFVFAEAGLHDAPLHGVGEAVNGQGVEEAGGGAGALTSFAELREAERRAPFDRRRVRERDAVGRVEDFAAVGEHPRQDVCAVEVDVGGAAAGMREGHLGQAPAAV
mmetsp:Transcript_8684/g.21879  ORF Transcript_8684/g.21879 Transcript_8684/m.21879 type:complete len:383 (+) Transcript_8684:110-1258(+)